MGTGLCGILYDGELPSKGMQMSNILWGFLSFLFWLCTFSTTLAVNLLFLFLAICFWLEAVSAARRAWLL